MLSETADSLLSVLHCPSPGPVSLTFRLFGCCSVFSVPTKGDGIPTEDGIGSVKLWEPWSGGMSGRGETVVGGDL